MHTHTHIYTEVDIAIPLQLKNQKVKLEPERKFLIRQWKKMMSFKYMCYAAQLVFGKLCLYLTKV